MGKSRQGKGRPGGGSGKGLQKGRCGGGCGKGGALSWTDAERLRRVFQRLDSEGGGQIEAAALGEALESGAWASFKPGTLALMVGMFDRNGDASISFPELRKLWKCLEEWTAAFRRHEAEGCGRMASKELHAALSSLGYRLSRNCVQELARRFERAEEASLAFDDFVQACVVLDTVTQVYKKRDVRRCGSVTYSFEDFVSDSVSLVFRLQSTTADQD
jgi:Ca2+-binding EF-hand superfamily protein